MFSVPPAPVVVEYRSVQVALSFDVWILYERP